MLAHECILSTLYSVAAAQLSAVNSIQLTIRK